MNTKDLKRHIKKLCVCHEDYKKRNMTDPTCQVHDIIFLIEELQEAEDFTAVEKEIEEKGIREAYLKEIDDAFKPLILGQVSYEVPVFQTILRSLRYLIERT